MTKSWKDDLRLIEAGFPCHQVGAETQRERGASSALPPLYFLHVWWARRPLTPSRAAILASLLPADTNPEWFLRQLGIEKRVVEIDGVEWTINGDLLNKIEEADGQEFLSVDEKTIKAINAENKIRADLSKFLDKCRQNEKLSSFQDVILKWQNEARPLDIPKPGSSFRVLKKAADPAWSNDKKALGKASGLWFPGDPYGYKRAFQNAPNTEIQKEKVILDPTAGGGSIPFEALRLGYKVIANELNPVASVILHATLEFPAKYGPQLSSEIEKWGSHLLDHAEQKLSAVFPDKQNLPSSEFKDLNRHLTKCPEYTDTFNTEYIMDYLYCRQVTCPNCGGEAPLLNTCWLSKEGDKQWGVKIIPDGRQQHGKVRFETYRASKGKGPSGEDPNFATVNRGIGTCVHCRQAIDADEIKSQARGESPHGPWKDRLYCVVAVRLQPKLDKDGKPQRYKSGEKKGEIKTEKIRFFRPPNQQDLDALDEAEKRLQENWDRWDAEGLIPTEKIPLAHKTKEPLRVGMPRWCDMFTPRQLLCHLTLVEELNHLKPRILSELGEDKGRAVVTYLQLAIDKSVDYNGKLTFWDGERGIRHVFSGHDFRVNMAFGEMIFTGPYSGAMWCLNQIVSAYNDISNLSYKNSKIEKNRLKINNETASYMHSIANTSVDLVCMDPPYYNNVQYAELSDYFYVWQKRTLKDIYPDYFKRRLTDKNEDAVANPDRDGSAKKAKRVYELKMGEIFSECRRVLKQNGVMTLMFTHKSIEAWETLTNALIINGWIISSCVPVNSESHQSLNQKGMAAASSAIFLSCRKRTSESSEPALWTGFGGTGVQQRIQQAVKEGLKEFQALKLNPVDEMVASYGRALRELSEQWPVIDGDEEVGPIRAMNEASRVVSENQIKRITNGRLNVEDLSPEAAMAVTLFGIYRLAEFPYDEALNLSRSLNIALENKTGGYVSNGRFIGYNTQTTGRARTTRSSAEENGFYAPLVRKGSKLRLARPEERHEKRKEYPQTEWDILHGTILAYREGDIPVVRVYLERHAEGKGQLMKDLLNVWAAEMPDEALKKEAEAIIFGLK